MENKNIQPSELGLEQMTKPKNLLDKLEKLVRSGQKLSQIIKNNPELIDVLDEYTEKVKWQGKLSVLHSLPHDVSTSMEYLVEYHRNNPDFYIPLGLYSSAVEVAAHSRNIQREEDFFVAVPESGFEKSIIENGLNAKIIKELFETMVRELSEKLLAAARIPILQSTARFEVSGEMKTEALGLTSKSEAAVFLAILILILRDALILSERYFQTHPDEKDKSGIVLKLTNDSIVVNFFANNEEVDSLFEDEIHAINTTLPSWAVEEPIMKGNSRTRKILRRN